MQTGAVFAVVLALMAAANVSEGDVPQMRDGRAIEGLVVEENDAAAVVAMRTAGGPIQAGTFPSEIIRMANASLPEPAARRDVEENAGGGPGPPAAPPSHSYYVIPISGEIGRIVTREVVEKSFREARLRKADVVVLEINSPGGPFSEVDAILKVLAENLDLPMVAYVKNALAQAAPIALTCREVYVSRSSRIGGAARQNGVPEELKGESQNRWAARCRAAVALGRHSPLIAEGLTNREIEVFIAKVDGKPALSSTAPVKGAVPFKRRGQLLALTSKQAVECGLAVAEIGGYVELGRKLDLPGWRKLGSAGAILGKHKAEVLKTEKALMKEAGRQRLKIVRWRKYLAIKPQLDEIRGVLPKLWSQGRALEVRRRKLKDTYIYEINKINHAYGVRVAGARQAQDPQREERARQWQAKKTAELNEAYSSALTPVKVKLDRLQALYLEKVKRRKQLILSLELP